MLSVALNQRDTPFKYINNIVLFLDKVDKRVAKFAVVFSVESIALENFGRSLIASIQY